MMKNVRKFLVFALMVSTLCLLVGFGSKSVELLDKGQLIDLNKAIQNADPGKEDDKISEDEEPTEDIKEVYQVIVRGETILFENQECKNTEELKNFIESIEPLRSEKSGISVLDDYAEAHTYREVLNVIKEAGINYTEEK